MINTKASIYKQILLEYQHLRDDAFALQRERREAVYQKAPQILAIDQEVALTGIRIAQLVLKTPEQQQALIAGMHQEMHQLQEEKKKILAAIGVKESYLQPAWQCKKCEDTGFVDGKYCSCFHQKLIQKAYGQSNLKQVLKYENFDCFDLDFYPGEIVEEEGISPRENIQHILSASINFSQNFKRTGQNLLFYGPTGVGKTFLCHCIAKEVLESEYTVFYITAGELFKQIEKERFSRKSQDMDFADCVSELLDVDLFILDDLGSEFSTILTSSEFFHIINSRILSQKAVVISTNLSPENMRKQYSDRVVSRILGNYQLFKFFGDDIRVLKKFHRFDEPMQSSSDDN